MPPFEHSGPGWLQISAPFPKYLPAYWEGGILLRMDFVVKFTVPLDPAIVKRGRFFTEDYSSPFSPSPTRCRKSPPRAQTGKLLKFLDKTHTQTHSHRPGRSPINESLGRSRDQYLQNTQQTQETNISALCGIRTRDPSS